MLTKLDLKQTLKHLYNPSAKECVLVDVPPMNFLMIDGTGDPNTAPAYKDAVEALYAVSYTLKFAVKKTDGIDYPVMPLEGLWWVANMADFSVDHRDDWQWTMLIMQPDLITPDHIAAALKVTQAKKHLPSLPSLRFESFHEGTAAHILHLGPYKDEAPTISRLHAFIAANGGTLSGKHHEIYLGDPRKTAPANLKTVLRQPYRK